MRILVTGGEGFIGSHLIERLKRDHDNVKSFDVKKTWRESVTNAQCFKDVLRITDAVYHLAALTSAPESIKFPKKYWRINVEGTETLIKNFDGPITFASSAAVHQPLNPYALTKVVCEDLLKDRPQTRICRFYNVFGEGDKKSVVYHFIKSALMNRPIHIFGDGYQTRTFIYVKDLVENLRLTNEKKIIEFGDMPMTVYVLANTITKLINTKSEIIFQDKRPGDPNLSICPDHISFLPYGFKEGLNRTIHWMKKL